MVVIVAMDYLLLLQLLVVVYKAKKGKSLKRRGELKLAGYKTHGVKVSFVKTCLQ